jgi:protein phosphatase
LQIPSKSLVVLIGPSGSGKSTFANKFFHDTEILCADTFRRMVRDREDSFDVKETNHDAWSVLHHVVQCRLAARRLTVIDATNVKREDRLGLVEIAREHNLPAVAIVLNVDYATCAKRNCQRPNRPKDSKFIMRQTREMWQHLGGKGAKYLYKEGFKYVYVLTGTEAVDAVESIERLPMPSDKRGERGPFDIIGDVHGCYDELTKLLADLGYMRALSPEGISLAHPDGRKAVFLGDIVDRGPRVLDCVRLVQQMVQAGDAFCIPGNHDKKFTRALRGNAVKVAHGLEQSMQEIESLPDETRDQTKASFVDFFESLPHHLCLDGNRLVAAHAGMPKHLQNRHSGRVWEFALYGETTGETDEYGLPVRADWAAKYDGHATVVYGHTPVVTPEWINKTLCIDTGCVFGGKLTALRWPEDVLVSVPAARVYSEPVRPLVAPAVAPAAGIPADVPPDDGMLTLPDLVGDTIISARLAPAVKISGQRMLCGLEIASCQAVPPRWLIYVPPTMSPVETSRLDDYLEHPADAFEAFARLGTQEVVCEAKHMGSRAVVIVCKDTEVAARKFGAGTPGATGAPGTSDEAIGIIYTRTGRRFFASDKPTEAAILHEVQAAVTGADLWQELQTDWLCLDTELMPWSTKAGDLLRNTYAPTGSSAIDSLTGALALAEQALTNGKDTGALVERLKVRADAAQQYDAAWRHYCWQVNDPSELRVAPFHFLAAEGRTFVAQDQVWHMQMADRLAAASASGVVTRTWWKVVDVADSASRQAVADWWTNATEAGHEGMVVKSRTFVLQNAKGLCQPALKVRGRKYLRIIYGPEYLLPENLKRLKRRGLGAKRKLALNEFALGVEGLERFVRGEPLARVHECALGVLALESEPVDPRL